MNEEIENRSHPNAPLWIAIPALIAVNALWGLSFPIMKSLNEIVDSAMLVDDLKPDSLYRVFTSSWMIGIRFTIAFAMLLIFFKQLVFDATRKEWMVGTAIGFFFYIGLVLQVIGLSTIPASRSGFLTSLTAVFMPVIVTVFLRMPPTLNAIAGVVVALAGVSVLTGLIELDSTGVRLAQDSLQAWTVGDSLTTLGALFFTIQILLLDRFSSQIRSISITPGMFLSVSILASVTAMFLLALYSDSVIDHSAISMQRMMRISQTPAFLCMLVVLGGFCSLVSFLWMNKYQPSVNAVQASIIYSIEPVFASCWALVLPEFVGLLSGLNHANELVSSQLVIGGSLVLLANIIAVMKRSSGGGDQV